MCSLFYISLACFHNRKYKRYFSHFDFTDPGHFKRLRDPASWWFHYFLYLFSDLDFLHHRKRVTSLRITLIIYTQISFMRRVSFYRSSWRISKGSLSSLNATRRPRNFCRCMMRALFEQNWDLGFIFIRLFVSGSFKVVWSSANWFFRFHKPNLMAVL